MHHEVIVPTASIVIEGLPRVIELLQGIGVLCSGIALLVLFIFLRLYTK